MKILKASLFVLLVIALFTSCQKEYSLEGVNVKFPVGSWQFRDSAIQYTGNIDTAFVDSVGNTKTLHLTGTSLTGGENFSLLLISTSDFKTGVYRASLAEVEFNYFTSVKTIFQADQLSGEFVVNITSLGNGKIEGNFSGSAQDSTGNITQLTVGKFSSALTINSGTTVAAGTLSTQSGNCAPIVPNGTYTQGVALTSLNTVQVQVNVITPGSYNIFTNTVNGVSFSSSGTFNNAGLQDVILTGTGTPIDSSVQNFTVTFNASVCNFSITFLPGTTPPPGDYFPTTVNSNWTYGFIGGTNTDSFRVDAIGFTPVFNGNTYSTSTSIFYPYTGPADDSVYYRKPGGDYYQYGDVGSSLGFENPVFGEYIFLKDNVPVNTVWQSPDFSGTFSGVPVSGFFKATILEKAVPVTVGSLNFTDVIKVQYDYYYSIAPSTPFATEVKWFAKGVGLVYDELATGEVVQIGSYQVF